MKTLLAAGLAAISLAFAASAQDDPSALNAQAEAAVTDGRAADAIVLSERAWRAAEAQLGDRRDTSVPAISYARRLIMEDRAGEAAEPAARAAALVEAGLLDGDMTAAEAKLFVSLAAFAGSSGQEGGRDLRNAVEDLEDAESAYARCRGGGEVRAD